MFNMSHLSIILKSTEKPHTFALKDTSIDSVASNSIDMVAIQKSEGKFAFLALALSFRFFPSQTNK